MLAITGGAGFIGSAALCELNRRGRKDILIVDSMDHEEKVHNLEPLAHEGIVDPLEFKSGLQRGAYPSLTAILHLGAISSTRENDWATLRSHNVEYANDIIRLGVERNLRIVYASSAAVYGKGEHGYSDGEAHFKNLVPLNLYGKSKLETDLWAAREGHLSHVAGVRYFNVFGPNEYHKADMSSVICKNYERVRKTGELRLYRSYEPSYADGEQRRDFIYVKDAVDATLFLLETENANGIFNIGTGLSRTWNDVAKAMFSAMDMQGTITYIDMPDDIRAHYQYFSEADISRLRNMGYKRQFRTLEESVREYVRDYLAPHRHLTPASA